MVSFEKLESPASVLKVNIEQKEVNRAVRQLWVESW